MLKFIKVITVFISFFLMVNISIVVSFCFYDSFPFILDVLVLYFILPVLIGIGISWIITKIFSWDKNIMEHPVSLVLMILSLLMWLVIMIGSFTGVKEFVELNLTKKHLVGHEFSKDQIENAGFITLTDGAIQMEKMGTYHKEKSHKSGDIYVKTIYHYYAIPVVSKGKFQFWIVDYISYGKRTLDIPSSELLKYPLTAGVVVHESREQKKYQKAVDIVCDKYDIPLSEKVVFLKYEGTFDEMFSTNKRNSIIYFVLVNGLLVFLPVFFLVIAKRFFE